MEDDIINDEWLISIGGFKQEGDAWWTIPLPDQKQLGSTTTLRYCKGIVFINQTVHQGFTALKAAKIIMQMGAQNSSVEDDDKLGIIMRKNKVMVERLIKEKTEFRKLYWALTGIEI